MTNVGLQKLDQSTGENETELDMESLVNVGTQLPPTDLTQKSVFQDPLSLHRKISVETLTANQI